MTDPHLQGGGQVTYVTRLAGALSRLGHAVTIGCKAQSVLKDHAAALGLQAHARFVFKGGLRPWAWSHDLREMTHFIREMRPDIVHVSGSQDHWVAGLANRLLGRPVCVVRTRHNTYPVKTSFANRLLNRRWTDYQIVVCRSVCEDLMRHPAFDPARMCSVHNGVDVDQFRPDFRARAYARAEFGYSEEHIVCGIAARLVPAKGHEYLLRAAALLVPRYPHLRILALGQGTLEPRLRALADELGLRDVVQFAGFRADMPYCTQAFDIAVLPSVDCDTSSFSLKEEMAAEKPVLASDYGGLKEILDDGVEGLVAPAGTVDPLADALERLLSNPVLRLQMGAQGRDRVLRDFSIEVFAERTVAAYRRALEYHHERIAYR